MRKTILLLICLLHVAAYSQQSIEVADSIRELNEVVVDAKLQYTTAAVSVYIPDSNQKNAAQDATSLLNLMSIPQLSVDALTETVKTVGGHPVSIFIDYVEASAEDMSGLIPRDVKRIEYYNSPTDPRFAGRKNVINFVMQKYEWGGYTKINATQSVGVLSTDASVYSKMKYKSMSYDVYAGGQCNAVRNAGSEIVEEMRFLNLLGNGPANIMRMNNTTSENTHKSANSISLRALYDSDNIRLSNRVNFGFERAPESETANDVVYRQDWSERIRTHTTSSGSSMATTYSGEYLFTLPGNMTLDIGTGFEYGRNKVHFSYTGVNELSIINRAYEKSYSGHINPGIYWQPDDSQSFSAYAECSWQNNRIAYEGDESSRQTYGICTYRPGAKYGYASDKWSALIDFGWMWQSNAISNYKMRTSYPTLSAELTYSPSGNTQLLASYEYYETIPTASSTSPVLLQQDELMWYAGNPRLKNSPTNEFAMQGLWMPSNKWQLALTAFHYKIADRRVSGYSPEGPNGTMLRYYTNNGNYMNTMIGLNATAKFFDGKLTARVNPQVWLRKTSGVFAMQRNELTCTAQLTYYFGNFFASGWYVTPSHYPAENSGVECRTPSQYQLRLGWGNGSWNVGFSASNFFRRDWCSNKEILRSEYYNMSSKVYAPTQHMKFSLSATYTFGYGKKVARNDEPVQESSTSSAILR